MESRRIVRKQLSTLPCDFILGIIGPTESLTPNIEERLISSMPKGIRVREILPVQDFPNPPQSYFTEMGSKPLSSTIFVLKNSGSYSDLHHVKIMTREFEDKLKYSSGDRRYNINPGALGTYGLCLASHKSGNGTRPDISLYSSGFHPHLLFGGDTFYERIMSWDGQNLNLVGRGSEGKFPEYTDDDRVKKFEEIVSRLPRSNLSVELV